MRGYSLLRQRDFGLLWWGQLLSQIGDSVTKLALLWFVYAVTGSPLKTTIIGVLQTLPPIVLGPIVGVYLDRFPKRPILVTTELARALVIGVLPALVGAEAFTLETLYLLVFAHALASAVFNPAVTAVVPGLVARSEYTAANALLQGTTSIGLIVGPVLSGLGIAALSAQAVLSLGALAYVASALCLLPLRLSLAGPLPPTATLIEDLVDGLRFAICRQPAIVLLILTAGLYSFGTSAFSTLFPVFGRTLLDLGPLEVGYLWSAMGVGLLLVSLGVVRLSALRIEVRMLGIAVASAISAAALCLLLAVADRAAAAVVMGLIGGGFGVFTPVAWSVLQELAPDHLVSRTIALYTAGAMTAAIVGMTTVGWITQAAGAWAGLLGIAAVLFVTALLAGLLRGAIRTHPCLTLVGGGPA